MKPENINIEWINIEVEKPKLFQDIVVVTSVGRMDGFYLKNNIVRTKQGLFHFTKWKSKENQR